MDRKEFVKGVVAAECLCEKAIRHKHGHERGHRKADGKGFHDRAKESSVCLPQNRFQPT